jgi:hypothetical protein
MMKRLILLMILLSAAAGLYAPAEKMIYITMDEGINPFAPLWEAVKFVETGVNPDTINIVEQAYGPGQIRQVKLDDFNEAQGKETYTLTDCMNETVAREIFMWHCSAYSDLETAARRWNGSGPMTEEYWRKVERQLRACSK